MCACLCVGHKSSNTSHKYSNKHINSLVCHQKHNFTVMIQALNWGFIWPCFNCHIATKFSRFG